jgi:hypothetical protein
MRVMPTTSSLPGFSFMNFAICGTSTWQCSQVELKNRSTAGRLPERYWESFFFSPWPQPAAEKSGASKSGYLRRSRRSLG